jgi:DNA-binding NarL/FixJ family response regulator
MPIRLVLAEDSDFVREGVALLIDTQPDLELVSVCRDFDELSTAVARANPAVVLTDVRMPPTFTDEGIRAAQWLREHRPEVGVVLFTHYAEPEYALGLFEAGSERRGYLLKERVGDIEELSEAIRRVAGGGTVVDPRIVEVLVASRRRSGGVSLELLTPREQEVLAEIAKGRTNAAISESLVLSQGAVEKHISSIFAKLGLAEQDKVHRRVRAVLMYLGQDG